MLKKKSITCLLASLFILSFCGTAIGQTKKVAYIDWQYILARYSKSVEVQQSLEQESRAADTEFNNQQRELTQLQEELNRQSLLLSEEAKRQRQTEIQRKYTQLQTWAEQTRQALLKQENDLMAPIIEKIRVTIEEVGKEEGYDYIITSEALLFAQEKYNITEQVLEKLEKATPKS